eukprot:2207332-Prymnesium_polylepis.1
MVSARLAANCADWSAFITFLVFEWTIFMLRSATLYMVTNPNGYRSKLIKGYLFVMTFDRVPRPPFMVKGDYRAFDYMLETTGLTVCMSSLIISYGVLQACGIGSGDAPLDFMFPGGWDSLRFLLLAMANDQ